MKKITLLLFIISLNSSNIFAQLTAIPDANFEQALIDLGYDAGPIDGFVPTANIDTVTSLNVFNKGITDLTGIKDFSALTLLNCNANMLTSLDVSQNILLETLFCTANFIKNLDTSANTKLTHLVCNNNLMENLITTNALQTLDCNANSLTSLNLTNYSNLITLDCSSNQLINLPLTGCTDLINLDASNNSISGLNLSSNINLEIIDVNINELSALDLSNNLKVVDLNCTENMISNLDLSVNTNLSSLLCNNNQLLNLDLSNHTNLTNISCHTNQLESLNVRNGNNNAIADSEFNATNNPNLICISVDDISYSNATWSSIDPQTQFSENCEATTFVPDDNFEQALIDLGYDSGPLDDNVLTVNINTVTNLDVSAKSINDLTGIADFVALESLNCSINNIESSTFNIASLSNLRTLICALNQIDTLDISNNTLLEEINCNSNSITSLDLTSNPNLIILYCDNNQLTSINLSNNADLEELRVSNNSSLASLDVSNSTLLTDLRCTGNNLSSLNINNNTVMQTLFCNDNSITALNVSNNSLLETLRCQNNSLNSLDLRNGNNPNLTDFDATSNPSLTCISVNDVAFAENNFTGIDPQTTFSVDCSEMQTFVPNDNFEQALIDLGYDVGPLNNYLPTSNINTITVLNVQNKNIEDLTGIEDFITLEELICSINQLTFLDVSNLSNLKILTCFDNQLTNLDLSNNAALEKLFCQENLLMELDLTNNSVLNGLNCSSNQLTAIDMRNGNNSEIINNSFDATNNPNLLCIEVDDLTFSENNWTNIDPQTSFGENGCGSISIPDVNFEQALIDLGFDTNGLTGDISETDALTVTTLIVADKNISDLTGIEGFTNLSFLNCMRNQLTSLDISNNTALNILTCRGNQLTNLDVSQNSNLTSLTCFGNQLTSLDISQNVNLTSLACFDNQITSLDVTNNILLTALSCYSNQLTSLDVSQNTLLTSLLCHSNVITELDLSLNTDLITLFAYSNDLISLNVKNGNNTNVTDFAIYDNSNLNCVQVDNAAYSTTNWTDIDVQTSFSENCTLSISDFDLASHLNLYPNPATDVLYIKTSDYLEISSIEIFNISGKKVATGVVNDAINVSQLKSGFYFVSIVSDNVRILKKLIIK